MSIRNFLAAAFISALGLLAAPLAVNATPVYTYVGSFTTDGYSITYADGTTTSEPAPYWGTNPQVYSAVQAAAFIFGGSASNYVTSTIEGSVNQRGWYDGWGDHAGYAYDDTYSLDSTGLGYNGCSLAGTDCQGSAYSAYISDGFSGVNYVYSVANVSAVPLPASVVSFGTALITLTGFAMMRRKSL